jgi:Dynein light chain type 1
VNNNKRAITLFINIKKVPPKPKNLIEVKHTDMPEELQEIALNITSKAMEHFTEESLIANYIKTEMDAIFD